MQCLAPRRGPVPTLAGRRPARMAEYDTYRTRLQLDTFLRIAARARVLTRSIFSGPFASDRELTGLLVSARVIPNEPNRAIQERTNVFQIYPSHTSTWDGLQCSSFARHHPTSRAVGSRFQAPLVGVVFGADPSRGGVQERRGAQPHLRGPAWCQGMVG